MESIQGLSWQLETDIVLRCSLPHTPLGSLVHSVILWMPWLVGIIKEAGTAVLLGCQGHWCMFGCMYQ